VTSLPSFTHKRKVGCPSDLDLDELLAGDLAGGPRQGALERHLEACGICVQRLARRRADPVLAPDPLFWQPKLESLATSVTTDGAAPIPDRPAEGQPPRPQRRRRVFGLAGTGAFAAAGAVALAVLVVARQRARPLDGTASDLTKGALALTVHVQHAAGGGLPSTIEPVNGTGRLRAGEEIRFSIAVAAPGFAVVLGLDARPSVSIYVPAAGTAPAGPVSVSPTQPATLPGSVIADATPGFERIVAVVCPTTISPATLRGKAEAALSQADGRPEQVASLGTGCLESAVLFRKTPPP
jgi:hypothetical protein